MLYTNLGQNKQYERSKKVLRSADQVQPPGLHLYTTERGAVIRAEFSTLDTGG